MTLNINNVEALLLDIEGTTTSITFVKNILFPHVRYYLTDYVKSSWGRDEFMKTVDDLRKQVDDDKKKGIGDVVEILSLPETPSENAIKKVQDSIIANVLWQMDADRKTTSLKQLQGQMWQEGYSNGQLKAHVYEDVESSLDKWKKQGKKIYIYSSGSVEAQKLLFGCTIYGNLLHYLDGYFDTNIGAKFDSESYKKIAEIIGRKPQNIVFLTDIPKEASAALEAGMKSVILIREGNAPLTKDDLLKYQHINTFDQLQLV